ncbi:acyl-CoA thioesterase [Bacillus sp. B1-b2]|uniref:acyl-CoA thioesterase n=1 Tax=Bacillus sp. B1-b2 TaxID=2653201 RepID=UPI001261E98A|nr:thioesterase family protein [Bacillus sp. B1-b2]KAB7672471.1 acyl-CoA thioesterase [Bacillus sp. B1-b2]
MKQRRMLMEEELKINGYDIDVMGIVSNIVYVRWFEDLRMAFLDKFYPFDEMFSLKISPILIQTECQYQKYLTIFDKPVGRCWVTYLGDKKWEMEFEIVTADYTHCIGKQSGLFYDLNIKKTTDVPKRLIEQYTKEEEM